MNRSDFIKTFFRITILVALGWMVALFAKKGKLTLDDSCSEDFQCGNCSKKNNCRLPGAEKTRN